MNENDEGQEFPYTLDVSLDLQGKAAPRSLQTDGHLASVAIEAPVRRWNRSLTAPSTLPQWTALGAQIYWSERCECTGERPALGSR